MSSAIKASCHCSSIQFEVELLDGLKTARRCNCSMCRMRGAVAVSANLDAIHFICGEDKLSKYQFNIGTAKYYFCSVCGIYTHHQRRSSPNMYGVNAACLESVSPFDFEEIAVLDGENHPRDHGQGPNAGTVGTLKFIKN